MDTEAMMNQLPLAVVCHGPVGQVQHLTVGGETIDIRAVDIEGLLDINLQLLIVTDYDVNINQLEAAKAA